MKWNKEKINADTVREFSSRFGIDLLTSAILLRRGLTAYGEILFYLENDLRYLHNPFLFAEMEEAVDRVHRAAAEGERVLIFGDRDVDGITSTVLLYQELTGLGLEVEWELPLGDDPYGISMESVEGFAERDGTLIITVDCGISAHAEIARAREAGIDTIIIDHHLPHETIPHAFAIINPKMEDSGYPFEGLAGCAVAAKFIWALRFAKTNLYNRPVCLLNLRPGNETYIIEAVTLVNLVETGRVVENIVPGMVPIEQTRLLPFLQNREIFVYDTPLQKKAFRRVFGEGVELNVFDMAPEIWKAFPQLEGKSLYRMLELSKMARYREETQGEIEILSNLFASYVFASEPSISKEYLSLLDLVALGTLADLMPLRDENRILVRLGMEILKKAERPGLYELMFKQGLLRKKIGTKDVSWYIAPLINATGRMGTPDTTVRLFLSESEEERSRLAEEIINMNKERRSLGGKTWEKVLSKAYTSYDEFNGKMLMVAGRDIHRGITGIIASRLVNHFNAPAFVVSIQDAIAIGSVRSGDEVNVKEMLAQCSDLFIDYGGHDCAAGFSIERGNLSLFEEKMKQLMKTVEPRPDTEEILEIDAELPEEYMNPDLIKVVELFEPYGEGNPPLLFCVQKALIKDISIVGKTEIQHAKLSIEVGKNIWPALFWKAADRVDRDFSVGDSISFVFRLGRNYFQNREQLQLTIVDIKR
jgi:single-stranded-DNA-specific exonuclease